ncbi:VanZ family protein [Niallia sp. 03133]|uniref:VanZ family protein n=1 Tax=Niallia sp. 03133 TaxID=3458060 RepID=UPI00404499D0
MGNIKIFSGDKPANKLYNSVGVKTYGIDKKAINRRKVQKGEMGKQIVRNSAHLSYYFVLIILFILWIIDVFFICSGKNYTLFIALCIAYAHIQSFNFSL